VLVMTLVMVVFVALTTFVGMSVHDTPFCRSECGGLGVFPRRGSSEGNPRPIRTHPLVKILVENGPTPSDLL
jgi:hypothetical protein